MSPKHSHKPVAVIDIGSNSIRLVIYAELSRAPIALFNEKALCALAKGMDESGKIQPKRLQMALECLSRFRAVLDTYDIEHVSIVATSAVREAKNVTQFIKQAEAIIGYPITVVSAKEEARLSSLGVFCTSPSLDSGLIGDLGGGSLELSLIQKHKIQDSTSLLLGHQRLTTLLEHYQGKLSPIRQLILDEISAFHHLKRRGLTEFFAVGGQWRDLAEKYLEITHYPLEIIDGFRIPAKEITQFLSTHVLSPHKLTLDEKEISRGSWYMAALVLKQIIREFGIQHITFSSYGIREGVLYDQLSPKEQTLDPLLVSAQYLGNKLHATPQNLEDLTHWVNHFMLQFEGFSSRLTQAILYLCDISIFETRHIRSRNAFERVITLATTGLTHDERISMAIAISVRYGGNLGASYLQPFLPLVSHQHLAQALVLGQLLRLAQTLCCRQPGLLPYFSLDLTENELILCATPKMEAYLLGDRVSKYLDNLAKSLHRTPKMQLLNSVRS